MHFSLFPRIPCLSRFSPGQLIPSRGFPLQRPVFLRIVRASAWYDLLVTAPFFTPWSFALAHRQLSALNVALGGLALPPFGVFHTLFCCLMGSLVLVWSLLRLRQACVTLGRYDAAARLLFALWMGWALMASGAPVLWLFFIPECGWALVQGLPVTTAGGGDGVS
jgi:hypothetical protein